MIAARCRNAADMMMRLIVLLTYILGMSVELASAQVPFYQEAQPSSCNTWRREVGGKLQTMSIELRGQTGSRLVAWEPPWLPTPSSVNLVLNTTLTS